MPIDSAARSADMNNEQHKFFLYTRKSTDVKDKQVRSVEDQIAELRAFAKQENLNVVDVLVEKKSAKIPGKPIFNEMLNKIENDKANGILVWRADRLARNSVNGGRIIYLLDTGKLAGLKFPTLWFENTSQGKFMLNIVFGPSKHLKSQGISNLRLASRAVCGELVFPYLSALRATESIDKIPESLILVGGTGFEPVAFTMSL